MMPIWEWIDANGLIILTGMIGVLCAAGMAYGLISLAHDVYDKEI